MLWLKLNWTKNIRPENKNVNHNQSHTHRQVRTMTFATLFNSGKGVV